jgi:CubicO group peptidase (beta-lactamase class C family)
LNLYIESGLLFPHIIIGTMKLHSICILIVLPVLLDSGSLTGCKSARTDRDTVAYVPVEREDWKVSTPAAQGLDPSLVGELYSEAAGLKTIYGLLVIKNGYLVAEEYFHEGSIDRDNQMASVTKSFTGTLVGMALGEGYLESLDQKMMDFFPELTGEIKDSRKMDITIRELLQMRAGYPWEESTKELFEILYNGFHVTDLVKIPLVRDPGSGFDYSNLSSHLLGIIVSRATGADLLEYANRKLFPELNTEPGDWGWQWDNYRSGLAGLSISCREMARFGQMFLNGGEYNGQRIISSQWIEDAWQLYTEDAWYFKVGKQVKEMDYGYQWWSVKAGKYRYYMAWGHGGQQIVVIPDQNMVVVLSADDLYRQHGSAPWKLEKANLNLVADFIASLP